jgi:large subunit ribosomal protein LP2
MKFVVAHLQRTWAPISPSPLQPWRGRRRASSRVTPTKEDVHRTLGAVGTEVEEDWLDLLFAQLEGKDIVELLAAGREKLAYALLRAAGGK